MQFLKLFSTVCAVCCTFVPEGTRGMKSEDGKMGDDKKAIVESVSMQLRLNELEELLNELYSAAEGICDVFLYSVIPIMRPEEIKNSLKYMEGRFHHLTNPINGLEFKKPNYDAIRTCLYKKEPITKCDLLQIMFARILFKLGYCFFLQRQAVDKGKDNTNTIENLLKFLYNINKFRLDICHRVDDLFKESNSTEPNNQQTELQTWLEEMIMKWPNKVHNFITIYDDLIRQNDRDYIREVLRLKRVSLNIPKGTTIEDFASIIKTIQWTDLNNEDTTTTNPETSTKERR